ncbi:DUF4435 domain-containing protein [Heliorestis convoluta]|uniref:DUF4435 domain-containing protein n=1 Tax=Heliorestis convoluta TaxID=356322 RepID=A0A5Q2MZR6_9FIRM|nr:DUF4435 domain-containing protein [Heliorestis convoluta]QGG46943.1 hypothetical protein FTV88_0767 [Heliorestis convoluta]
MKEFLNATRLITKVKMLRSLHKGAAFLLVEGLSDARLYGKFMDKQQCQIIVGENKQNILGALTGLEDQNVAGYLAIVDLDYDFHHVNRDSKNNLIYTDSHDLETMLLASTALQNLLIEYGDEKKISLLEKKRNQSIDKIIVEAAATVGYLRWCSLEKKLAYRFENLDFSSFICETNLEVDEDKMIQQVIKNSKKPVKIESETLEEWLKEYKAKNYDPWCICCGHDAVRILLIGLLKNFGAYNAKKLTLNALEGSLRLAYTFDDFMDSTLYISILTWESHNKPYKLLKQRKIIEQAG